MEDLGLSRVERVALEYCAPRGIPLSVFLGRTVYPGDPQWLERDTAAALWWQADQANRCENCHQYLAESMADGADFAFAAEGEWCHGCRAIYREGLAMSGRNAYSDADPLVGTRYRFIKTPSTIARTGEVA